MKILATALLGLACMLPLRGLAQIYASTTDSEGNKNYWRICSANEHFQGKCIQDNTSMAAYPYYVNNYAEGNTKQEFELQVNSSDTTQYYFRNRSSRKFFLNGFQVNDYTYNLLKATTSKYSTVAFTITPLGEGQVLISYPGSDGLPIYLNATDESTAEELVYLEDAKDSRFAWYIVDAKNNPTAISPIVADEETTVHVLNGHIVVAGSKDYRIFDLTGREMPRTGQRSAGVYIVKTPQKNFKILVR